MRKTILAALIATIAALALFMPGSAGQGDASHNDPILFVHGYTGNASNWNTMIDRFQADGYDNLYAFTFSSFKSNASVAQDINLVSDLIRSATGADKIDIITHSMGGLSSRYYLKHLGGTSEVDDWVSLGGPNHGTIWAYGCWWFSPCNQMIPGSSFLNSINSGDETPGSVKYGTWRSPCDELVIPSSSTSLSGATNTQTACIGHGALITNATVYNQIEAFLD